MLIRKVQVISLSHTHAIEFIKTLGLQYKGYIRGRDHYFNLQGVYGWTHRSKYKDEVTIFLESLVPETDIGASVIVTREELDKAIDATKEYMTKFHPGLKSPSQEDMMEVYTLALTAAAIVRQKEV